MSILEQSLSSTISSGANNYNDILLTRIGNNNKIINQDLLGSDSDTKNLTTENI